MKTDDHIDLDKVVAVWQRNKRIRASSVTVYLCWIGRYQKYCLKNGLCEVEELNLEGATRFARLYSQSRKTDPHIALCSARSALRALSLAMSILKQSVPQWKKPERPRVSPYVLVAEFATFLRSERGSPEGTIQKKTIQIEKFVEFLKQQKRRTDRIRLVDVDTYVLRCAERYARTTTADICSTLRLYLKFLHSSGRIAVDLGRSVVSPRLRRGEKPLRALLWESVVLILQAVDRSSPTGRRDYCLLLMMSAYGLGAGEVIRVSLDDINWRSGTLHVVRPKTGIEFGLPLLPAVAESITDYLMNGRPVDALTRHLFVSETLPYAPLSASSSVRHIMHKHARVANVTAPFMGTHALRHSHANRQMEQGTDTKLIGDILGHSHPSSTSAYIRISTERLRALSLEVPV